MHENRKKIKYVFSIEFLWFRKKGTIYEQVLEDDRL
jgi:hypothetical protein